MLSPMLFVSDGTIPQSILYSAHLHFVDESTNKMLPAFQALNIPVTKTILIHGVSGVGKTTLVK
jgi:ABC-type bacteriocin/lantibiotic exporter with double-glycine peptidase domain